MSADSKTLDFDRIMDILPHRYPYLMVDRAMVIPSEKKAVGIKNVTINEPFFQGHFPATPVMPGMLILETMVQTGGIMIRELMDMKHEFAFLKSISRAKFRKPVFPGDRLVINAKLIRWRSGIARISATATVFERIDCQAEFTLGFRENIREILHPPEFAPSLYLDGAQFKAKPMTDINGVINILPHRYPFILVDSILELKDSKMFGLKNVTGNEPFFRGHFPGHAVMPGTLLVEAMAQVGGVYILNEPRNKGKLGYLMGIDYARFRNPVRPGDQLVIEAQTVSLRMRGGKAQGRVYVGKRVIAEILITFVLADKMSAAGI